MIKKKEKSAKLYRRTGALDAYGQESEEHTMLAEITGSLLEYERQINHTSPIYDEVTKVFITDYKNITDNCVLEIEDKEYHVKYAPDSLRKKVIYLGC